MARPETFVEPQIFRDGKSPAAETSEMPIFFPA